MEDCDKNEESSYLQYWEVHNLYRWGMPQKLPVDSFQWVENASPFSKELIRIVNEDSKEGYFLEVDVQFSETFTMIYRFYQKE